MSGAGELLNMTATTNYYNSSKQKIGIFSLATGAQASKITTPPSSHLYGVGLLQTINQKPGSWLSSSFFFSPASIQPQ